MINFITQHWLAIIIYLIGCILAYGRINAAQQRCIDNKIVMHNPKFIKWFIVAFSWLGLCSGIGLLSQDGGKWFKWLPIVLMMFCMGCAYIPEDSKVVSVEVYDNTCKYRIEGNNAVMVHVIAPCGWYKIGDKPIRPIADTTKQ